jgi:hypothetical protein
MSADVFVFYAGLVLVEYSHDDFKRNKVPFQWTPETYNGSYLYVRNPNKAMIYCSDPGWYRPDGTPVSLEDVPVTLRTWELILT